MDCYTEWLQAQGLAIEANTTNVHPTLQPPMSGTMVAMGRLTDENMQAIRAIIAEEVQKALAERDGIEAGEIFTEKGKEWLQPYG